MKNKSIDQKVGLLPTVMRLTLLLLFVVTFQLHAIGEGSGYYLPEENHSQIAAAETLQQQKKSITGTVVDATGMPIIGQTSSKLELPTELLPT